MVPNLVPAKLLPVEFVQAVEFHNGILQKNNEEHDVVRESKVSMQQSSYNSGNVSVSFGSILFLICNECLSTIRICKRLYNKNRIPGMWIPTCSFSPVSR